MNIKDSIPMHSSKFEWQKQLEKELKGVTYDHLTAKDRNGINRFPFYVLEDLPSNPTMIADCPDWEICAKIYVSDEETANGQALNALKYGASGLIICFEDSKEVSFQILLKDIGIQYIYLHFVVQEFREHIFQTFLNYLHDHKISLDDLNLSISYDPVARVTSELSFEYSEITGSYIKFISFFDRSPYLSLDGTQYHNAGATSAYELACILAHLNEYLDLLNESGKISAVQNIHISMAIGTDFFEQISKLRAARALVDCLTHCYDIAPAVHLHVESSLTMISPLDPNNNLLRNAISGMAAVLGSCNSLFINPYDFEIDRELATRLALTQQILFKEEAHFNKVNDTASGSYFIEALTNSLSEKSWELFKSIEQSGGLLKAFKNGEIQRHILLQANSLVKEFKEGKRVMVGVNKFINDKDHDYEVSKFNVASEGILTNIVLAEEILKK